MVVVLAPRTEGEGGEEGRHTRDVYSLTVINVLFFLLRRPSGRHRPARDVHTYIKCIALGLNRSLFSRSGSDTVVRDRFVYVRPLLPQSQGQKGKRRCFSFSLFVGGAFSSSSSFPPYTTEATIPATCEWCEEEEEGGKRGGRSEGLNGGGKRSFFRQKKFPVAVLYAS